MYNNNIAKASLRCKYWVKTYSVNFDWFNFKPSLGLIQKWKRISLLNSVYFSQFSVLDTSNSDERGKRHCPLFWGIVTPHYTHPK